MAIKIEFVNLIIPIQKINSSKLEGGFGSIVEKYKNNIGSAVWFDKYLFRIGWMDTWYIDGQIDFWKEQGLIPLLKDEKGIEKWEDVFAISTGHNQFIRNCDWINVDFSKNIVWHKNETEIKEIYPNSIAYSYEHNFN